MTLEALERAIAYLLSRLKEMGNNFSKCHLLTVGHIALYPHLAAMKGHGIGDNEGLRILGTPVGKAVHQGFLGS